MIADYILYRLNKEGKIKSYIKWMGLDGPLDCITTALTKAALHHNVMMTVKDFVSTEGAFLRKPNFTQIASMFIEKFRCGEFGTFVLDDVSAHLINHQQINHHHHSRKPNLGPNETWVDG